MQPVVRGGCQENGRATAATYGTIALLLTESGPLHIEVVERIPNPFDLEVFIKIDKQGPDDVNWVVGTLAAFRKHSFQAGDGNGVAIRKANGVVMEARDALNAVRLTDRLNSIRLDLVGDSGDVGLPKDVADEIHLAQDLVAAVLFVDAAGHNEETAAGEHAR